ncbi:piRNA biogenesis protein EXD1 isoform X3 [Nerophis lumbriciformis]|uniref:piRNA biogenesis protein EXD1 isoform X3 n=2 Tax=Nerophis lumbriciformis TaxID=546530 RepID=UPI002ADF9E79|nr:piRNA biogenesis protein EXD1-like isoform X3 [Nerophis lumbriciformis]
MIDDSQFISIFKGKRIKLTLKSSSYLGVVQRIDANKALVLTNVINGSNGREIPGSRLFFGPDIHNVEFTNEEDIENGNIPEDLEKHLEVKSFQPYRNYFFHDDDEEYINFEVIDEFHEKFGLAVMNIKKQHVVGVGADGVALYKHGRMCWLQIATKNKVYLFDILLLGARAFKNGLSMILQNKHILKVIHDCRAIAGCLNTQFGVKLTNVFDTQVADVMCFHSETGGFLPDRVSTLQEVVSLHLKVPSSQLLSLKIKSKLTMDETEMWYTRPCPIALLKVMTLSVIHLQPLRLVLLDSLLTDYMALVDTYITNSQYPLDDLESINMAGRLCPDGGEASLAGDETARNGVAGGRQQNIGGEQSPESGRGSKESTSAGSKHLIWSSTLWRQTRSGVFRQTPMISRVLRPEGRSCYRTWRFCFRDCGTSF